MNPDNKSIRLHPTNGRPSGGLPSSKQGPGNPELSSEMEFRWRLAMIRTLSMTTGIVRRLIAVYAVANHAGPNRNLGARFAREELSGLSYM
jgi:hypothetical protein